MNGLIGVALKAIDSRFSVIPTGPDKKCTLPTWKVYQSRLMTDSEARDCFAKASRIAVICGKVSGNLECLDFDDPDTYEPFLELLKNRSPGLSERLLSRKTPSGGYHLIYRCESSVAGNQKLAMAVVAVPGPGKYPEPWDRTGKPKCEARQAADGSWFIEASAIETRGEGGYYLTSPSPGYEILHGSMVDCPTITLEEMQTIHSTARFFDKRPAKGGPTKTTPTKGNADSPGSRFNEAHTVADILETHGWSKDKRTTAGMGWTRPGKDSGTSGVLLAKSGNFYVFSSNAAPLEPGRSYDAFGLFTQYKHAGNYSAAAKELSGSSTNNSNNSSRSTRKYYLDDANDEMKRLQEALDHIPVNAECERHNASTIIGWALRHNASGIEYRKGESYAAKWDERTGGNSSEVFTTCDPAYNLSQPITVASIYDLAKKNGWDGQPPWSEAEPLISHTEATPYPLEALPETIRQAVEEVNSFVQSPVAITACAALSAVSLAVQALADVRRAVKLEGPTSIDTLAIADSGERKTTVDGHFTNPIREWEAEQREAMAPLVKEYTSAFQSWEAKKSGVTTSIKEYAKADKDTILLEQKMMELEMSMPIAPRVPRLLYTDATPEALAYALAHKWPSGGVVSSEAGIVFGGHAMGKDSSMRNMALINSLWDGASITVDRKTGPSFILQGARLTMGLAVQPEAIKAFLDSSKGLARGIGFLARFLVAWPASTQGFREFQEPPENWPHLSKFHRRIGALLDHPPTINDQGGLEPVMLELSPAAKTAWVEFHNEVELELRPGRDMAETRDVASKTADNAARLAALFHVFENGLAGAICEDHLRRAAAIASWHLYEARRFMEEIAVPIEISNASKLDAWLIGYCRENRVTEINRRTIQQSGPNCIRSKEALNVAIETLVDSKRVRIVKSGKAKIVQINPALLNEVK